MSYQVQTNVMVPMRDSTRLSTNVWIPEGPGPFPTLLVRTPYGSNTIATYGAACPNIFELMQKGYVVAVQECRGTFESEGEFVPHASEADDGEDMLGWLSSQSWCSGRIGAFGASYLGMVQWQVAAKGHPALKAIAPTVAPADFFKAPWYSNGGAFSTGIFGWVAGMSMAKLAKQHKDGSGDPGDMGAIAAMIGDLSAVSSHTPLGDHPALKKAMPWLEAVFEHPDLDEYWQVLSSTEALAAKGTPAFIIGGWYDLFLSETLRTYTTMRTAGATAQIREGQYLVIGPWGHTVNGLQGMYPDRLFGPAGSIDASGLSDAHIAYFDHYLKGKGDRLDRPRVRLFVMGLDQWRDENEWPLPDTEYVDFHLTGDGGAGHLSEQPQLVEVIDRYIYDPADPVPTHGGTGLAMGVWDGAADQRPVHGRADVLIFASDVLQVPLEVTGPVSATLFVSSNAVDTDFTAKLVDVHPDGRAIILCDGIQRMRYRGSLSEPKMMIPGEVYEITIDMNGTSNVFLPGHKIMVEISSSNFPRYDRNSNTGRAIAMEPLENMKPASNQLHRGGEHPSRVIFPLINR